MKENSLTKLDVYRASLTRALRRDYSNNSVAMLFK